MNVKLSTHRNSTMLNKGILLMVNGIGKKNGTDSRRRRIKRGRKFVSGRNCFMVKLTKQAQMSTIKGRSGVFNFRVF